MLSQRGRYALKALLHLARSEGGAPRQASAIAAAESIPRKFLEAILTDLVRHGFVQSVRGRHGGFQLARAAEAITFGDVIRIADGPLALLPCVSKSFYERCEDCTDEATCALRRVMAEVREQVAGILDGRTIADAIRDGLSGNEAPSHADRLVGAKDTQRPRDVQPLDDVERDHPAVDQLRARTWPRAQIANQGGTASNRR